MKLRALPFVPSFPCSPMLASLQAWLSAVMLVATVPLALLVAWHVYSALQLQHTRTQAELQRSAELLAAVLADGRTDAGALPTLLDAAAPPGGFIAVRDGGGRVLARAGAAEEAGGPSDSAWRDVPGRGWQVGVGLPRALLDEVERRTLIAALATITACLLLGLALATLAARRITDPLRELAQRGPAELSEPLRIREIASLRDALAEAQARLQRKASEFEALFASTPIGLAFQRGGERVHNAAMDALIGPAGAATTQPPAWLDEPRAPHELAQGGRHLLVQAVPLPEGGTLASAVDITERKRAEQRILEADRRLQDSQRLIDLAQEAGEVGFFRIDEHGADWTPGFARLFGFGAGGTPERLPLADLLERVHEDDRAGVEQGLREMAASQRERGTLEYRVTLTDHGGGSGNDADGATRWLASRVQMSFGTDGRPVHLVGATLNVNEQKALELERAALAALERRARLEAEAANRAKDEFLAMLGHELRNPLGAIASASEVLAQLGTRPAAGGDGGNPPALAESARAIIARQTRHLGRLVDDLLDIGRVISGKVTLSRHRLELSALVGRAIENFRLTGSIERHELRTRLQPVWIEADATRIEQVVNNLLGNALKYTPAGRRIELDLRAEDGQAVFSVTDHGDGIAPALLPHIFDLFVQGERLLDRGAGGLGVGLTLVRRLVEMHAGSVSAASSPAGSVFTVRLPAALGQTDFAALHGDDAAPTRVPSCRVLVIEDNEDARTTLCTMLELDGHRVSTAADGRQGLDRLLDERPDVAVVDIGLPGLSGFELARESRRSGYAGRLLALSGYGSDADVAQALRHGFDAHLAKPVDPQRLRELLAAAA